MRNHAYRILVIFFITASLLGCGGDEPVLPPPDGDKEMKLQPPPAGKVYHAAFPDLGGTEDVVSEAAIADFENLAGKAIAWVYFSNNWTPEKGGIHFPAAEVSTIRQAGKLPFIRMMPRSNFDEGGPDPVYTMARIIAGDFDDDLRQWAIDAKHTQTPLLVEFGTEVNGDWFPWNATYNGGDNKTGFGAPGQYDGMERFREAYKHIIDICRQQKVKNITWFYHCDVYSSPETDWNTKAGYYPGDDYINWIGVSVYGAQTPGDSWQEFAGILEDEWENIRNISPEGKPIAILEWGTIDEMGKKPDWIKNAFAAVKEGGQFYPDVKAMSYWHENFDETYLRIDSSPEALSAYRQAVSDDTFMTTPKF